MNTISLLNEGVFCPEFSITERLEEGAKSHSLIYTNNLKEIGKTYDLIKFAKKHGYGVLVSSLSQVEEYIEKYKYENINCCSKGLSITNQKYVIEEGVTVGESFYDGNIITGFTNIKPVDKETNYPDQILKSLKKDALRLSQRLECSEVDSDYKMLITNLRATAESIQYLEMSKRD